MDIRFIAIDWSGAKSLVQQRQKIWLAEATRGALTRLECGHSRNELTQQLIEEQRRDPHVAIGLDFAFSLPDWFLKHHGFTTALELWALVERQGETWLASCQSPWWGKPGHSRPNGVELFRRTEQSATKAGHGNPKSAFQIGGAGAVGTGSLRGMPLLKRLREERFSIWPFDPPGWPRVVEIYPRSLTGPVNKSDSVAREAYLRNQCPGVPQNLRQLAASCEDAFDAAVSALVMANHAIELGALPTIRDAQFVLEGMIWYPHESKNTPN